MDFVNLHGHSIYSIRDSIAKIPDLIKQAKALGMPAMALTDHGTIGGTIEFYKECKKNNIKPLLGAELYIATRSRFDKEHGIDKYYHLTVIAMNNIGWSNLTQLISESNKEEHFYHKPRVDRELLRKYNEGLICLSGCLASHLSNAILEEKHQQFEDEDGNIIGEPSVHGVECSECTIDLEEKPKKETFLDIIRWHKNVFGDRYYLEIQNHGLVQEDIVRDTILNVAKEEGIKIIATGDTHFVQQGDVKAHNIMLSVRNKITVNDPAFQGYAGTGYYLPDEEYLKVRFSMFPEAVTNTCEIAERCNVDFRFGDFKIPRFVNVREEDDMFADLAFKGLYEKFCPDPPKEYIDRLNEEIKTIQQMTYPSYFMIVAEYVNWARDNDIPVGPGRGSAAGALVSLCLGITEDTDPIQYGLSFSRFLNKGRSAIPIINFPEMPFDEWKSKK